MLRVFIAVGTVVVGVGAYAYKSWSKDDETENTPTKTPSYKISIMGLRSSGKTTLINHLLDKPPSDSKGEATLSEVRIDTFSYEGVEYKSVSDTSGNPVNSNPTWEKKAKESDYIIYLFRVDKIKHNDKEYMTSIVKDIKNIQKWLKDEKKPIFFIGTHCDLDEDYKNLEKSMYNDQILELDIIKDMQSRTGVGTDKSHIILGSIEQKKDFTDLYQKVTEIIKNAK